MPAMATTTKQDRVRELQRALYRAAKADGRMPAVKNVGEPCAGEPHARFEVAAGTGEALPGPAACCRRSVAPYNRCESREVGGEPGGRRRRP